jgi:O-antigen/teichoic acid export membrane protein
MVWHGLMYLPMWFLLKTQGPDATGILGAVRHLTQAVIIFTVAIITIVQSSIAKTWESKGHDVADRQFLLLFKMTMLLLFVLCGMGAVLSPVLVQVFPDRYAAGEVILPASLLFFLLAGQLQFLFVQFHLIERTRHIFVPLICGIVGNLMLGWLIIRPELDTTAALQATVWAGNLALTLALLVTVGLLVAERRPFDRGSLILLVAGFSIVLPGGVLVGLLLLISGLTLMTDWVMSSEEKVQIQAKATELLRRIRHAGSAESG